MKRFAIAIFISWVGLLVALLLLPSLPLSTHFTEQIDSSILSLKTNKRFVLWQGDCAEWSWKLEGIRAVYFNDQASVGETTQTVCLTQSNPPTLSVTLENDTTKIYHPNIIILVQSRAVWSVVVGWTLLVIGTTLVWLLGSIKGQQRLGRAMQAILTIMLSTLLMLAILEGFMRLWFSLTGTEEDRVKYVYTQERINQIQRSVMSLPFLEYGLEPNYDGHNAVGFRGEEIAYPKPEGVQRILTLGGSTTYGLGMDWEYAYPAQLQDILREAYGYSNVEVINGGVIGYRTWHSLANFAFRGLEMEPDLVIVYHAVNDANQRRDLSTDCYRGQNPARGLGYISVLDPYPSDLPPFVLQRFFLLQLGWMESPAQVGSNGVQVVDCEPDNLTEAERFAINTPEYFERNLKSMVGIAQVHNINIMLSTWAYAQNTPNEIFPDVLKGAVEEHNTLTRTVAEELQIPLIDLANLLTDRPDLFFEDGGHFNRTGTLEQAQLYAEFIDGQGLLQKP